MGVERIERSFEPGPAESTDRPSPYVREGYDDRLNHILRAATRVISRDGYVGASMRTVAQEAQVSLAGIYHYFDSKEKMLFLIQFRTFNSLLMNLKEKLHGVVDPVEQLRVMVRAHVEYFAANMEALKVCSHELDSLSSDAYEQTLSIRREYYSVTRAFVDRIIDERGQSRATDRHVATMSLFGMLNWLYRWYDPRRDGAPSGLARQIAGQFLSGIAGNSISPTPTGSDFAGDGAKRS